MQQLDSDHYTLADFAPGTGAPRSRRLADAHAYYRDFRAKGYFQHRRELLSPPDREVTVSDGHGGSRRMLMMGSNSYLGLGSDPRVKEAAEAALREFGTGSSGAAMLSGTNRHHRGLEEEMADWLGFDDAVIFPSGFGANIGSLSALVGPKDRCLYDELSHASIVDGLRMARARAQRFLHNDPEDLARHAGGAGEVTLLVEGVYSMDGDLGHLDRLLPVLQGRDVFLVVDEAHGLGVLGPEGRGAAAELGCLERVDLVTGSLGKSLAGAGGFAAGAAEVMSYLRLYARSYFFSTAPSPVILAAARRALQIIRSEPGIRERLHDNVRYLRRELRRLGWAVSDQPSAVVVVPVGDELTLRQVSRRVDELGLYVNPVPFPAVPRGQGRLRLGVMATHTRDDLDRTLEILERVGQEFGLLSHGVLQP